VYKSERINAVGNKRKERKAAGGIQLPTLQVLERATWVQGCNSLIKSIVVPVRNL